MPALDTLLHALQGKDESDPYVQGFGHIRSQFIHILGQQGLIVIADTGAKLDLSRHEPVETTPVDKWEDDNTVMETIEEGDMLHEKVIKPAKVKVGEYRNHGA